MSVNIGGDYHEKFDPARFLEGYTRCEGRTQHMLRCFYDAFHKMPENLKVLDYGSGPSLMPAMTAVTKASEIILCEYSPKNREVLRQWLHGEDASFDWTPHFDFVVRQLEGNLMEEAVKERQKQVRETVKAVVHCDLTEDPLIEKGYDQVYDAVISSLVIDTVPQTFEEFAMLLKRLGGLVKQGGALLLYFVEDPSGFYLVGDNKFYTFSVTSQSAESAVAAAGFRNIKVSEKYFCSVSQCYFFFLECIR